MEEEGNGLVLMKRIPRLLQDLRAMDNVSVSLVGCATL
jgi:hypothetical protein